MSKKIKKDILEQIEAILKDYGKLKATFEPLGYIGLLGKDQDEIAKINELITRTKVLIFSNLNEDSPYFKQIELHSKGKKGTCGRDELDLVMADLKVVYDNLTQKLKAIKESKRIQICVKRLYVFLKKYEIYKFLSTGDFGDTLMEMGLDDFWDQYFYDTNEVIAIHDDLSYIDPYETTFIELLNKELLNNKSNFIREIDHIVNALISHYKIQDFDCNEFGKRILDCGFNREDISQMKCMRIKNLSEILDKIPTLDVLPKSIDYQKYGEIFDQLKLPNAMFQYIFVCENILRKFIIQILKDNGYQSIDSIGNQKLSKAIQDKKNKEINQNYLPIRGDHDIFYLDLNELIGIIRHLWNDCFIDKFKDQQWIFSRIDSLYDIRCRVAHSSGYLTNDELKSVENYTREIIKQIDPYIK